MRSKSTKFFKDISIRQRRRLIKMEVDHLSNQKKANHFHPGNSSLKFDTVANAYNEGTHLLENKTSYTQKNLEMNISENKYNAFSKLSHIVDEQSDYDFNYYSELDSDIDLDDVQFHFDNLYCDVVREPEWKQGTSEMKFADELRACFIKHNISQNAISDLLEILNMFSSHNLPKDSRTFMKTPRDTASKIHPGNGGNYVHFGVRKGVIKSIFDNFEELPSEIKLNINIDGLPISKSSGSQFWPILAAIDTSIYTEPFLVGIYHGFSKPDSANNLLEELVNDLLNMKENGLLCNDKVVNVKVNAFICDAPARAFISGTKNHTGYFGCSKCTTEGDFLDNRVVFPELTASLRSDQSFTLRIQPEHHKQKSILEDLGIGMVSQIPLDPMHLVYLGVMKRLLHFWMKGKMNVRLNQLNINIVENRNKSLKGSICTEFARLPRSLLESDRWKATEFRLFLMYTGVVIMKGCLSKQHFNHFLSLHVAIRILSSEKLLYLVNFADENLKYFVNKYSSFYGGQNVTYNVHNMIHLSADVTKYGTLERFSAFKFENYLYKLKKKLKTSGRPLQQIVNRTAEENHVEIDCKKKNNHSWKIVYSKNLISYINFKNFSISSKSPNNCVILENRTIALIGDIFMNNGKLFISYKYYLESGNFFDIPCESSLIGIYAVENCNLSNTVTAEFTQIVEKCLILNNFDIDGGHIIMSLLHTQSSKT